MSASQRIHRLAAAIARFKTPGDALRERLLDETPHMARDTMAAGLDLSLAGWDETGIAALWSEEQPHLSGAVRPSLVAVVLGGVLPPSHIQAIAYPFLLGAELIVKTPARDPLFCELFSQALGGERLTVVGRLGLGGVLGRADAVIAVGDDDSVRAIRAETGVATPFLAYGHRTAVSVVLSGAVARSLPAAEDIARDVATFDQLGCLSPREVVVLGSIDDARTLANNLHDVLGRGPRRESLGPAVEGALRGFVEEHRLRGHAVFGPPDLQHGVVVIDGGEWQGTPGGRHLIVRAARRFNQLSDILAPIRGQLSAVGLAGGDLDPVTLQSLVRLGASRVCPVGQLQSPAPTWPHDGQRPLASLCRWFARA